MNNIEKSHWDIIRGVAFKHKDLSQFSEAKWIQLIRFFGYFIRHNGKKEDWFCNHDNIIEKEALALSEEQVNKEFFVRMNRPMETATVEEFRSMLNSMYLNSLTYLKQNPSLVTPSIKEELDKFQKMSWVTKLHSIVETSGGPMLSTNREIDGVVDSPAGKDLPTIQQNMYNAIAKMADFYSAVSETLDVQKVKGLPIQDKVKILKDFQFIFGVASKKTVNNTFTTINLNGSVKDLEKAQLDYLTKKE